MNEIFFKDYNRDKKLEVDVIFKISCQNNPLVKLNQF